MLHPAAHPPQQNAVMVDIHDQVKFLQHDEKAVREVVFGVAGFSHRLQDACPHQIISSHGSQWMLQSTNFYLTSYGVMFFVEYYVYEALQ